MGSGTDFGRTTVSAAGDGVALTAADWPLANIARPKDKTINAWIFTIPNLRAWRKAAFELRHPNPAARRVLAEELASNKGHNLFGTILRNLILMTKFVASCQWIWMRAWFDAGGGEAATGGL